MVFVIIKVEIIVMGVVGLLIWVGVLLNMVVMILIVMVLYKLVIVFNFVCLLKVRVRGRVIIFVVSLLKKFFWRFDRLNWSIFFMILFFMV